MWATFKYAERYFIHGDIGKYASSTRRSYYLRIRELKDITRLVGAQTYETR